MAHSLVGLTTWPWCIALAMLAPGSSDVGPIPRAPHPVSLSSTSATPIAEESGGASDCYTPTFTVRITPTGGPTFGGVISGDLEGTVVLTFVGAPKVTGVTFANQGIASWAITSGLGPTVVAFDTAFENRNQETDRPGSPAWLFENVGTHTGTAGVEKVRWTYSGAFDALTATAVHVYHGVICL